MREELQTIQHFSRRSILGVGTAGLLGVGLLAGCSLHTTHDSIPGGQTSNSTVNLLDGQWSYMPGASMQSGTLHIAHRGFKIVEQDGRGGQDNPPVNIYGTHLKLSGGIVLQATLRHIKGGAALDFYSSTPRVSDEFRVEPPRLRVSVGGKKLTVQEWDGKATASLTHQPPMIEQSFSAAVGNGDMRLNIADQGGELTFNVNDDEVGQVQDHNIFASGELYIGADAPESGGSFDVASLMASPLDGSRITAVNLSDEPAFTKDQNGLQSLIAKRRPGFMLGSNAAMWAIADAQYRHTIFGGNFGSITPENAMKWQFTEPQPSLYDFHEADALVGIARKNNMQVWGHILVFSEALPAWMQNLPTITPEQRAYVQKVMVNHITALVTHFRGKVRGWDVVNEPIKDYDDNGNFDITQPLRENVFYRAMGPSYIKIALETARKADPHALLAINEWGFSGLTNDAGDDRANAIYDLLQSLKSQHVPLDVFGDQAHIYDAGPKNDDIVANNGTAPILSQRLQQVAALGMRYRISEADAPGEPQPGDNMPDYGGSSQAQQFSGELRTCMESPACIGLTFWSVGSTDMDQTDSHTWQHGAVDSIISQNNQPNTSYAALQSLLEN